MLRRRRSEAGFTLVEVMASLVVFALVTIGVVPLLLTAMRGTNLTRSYTVGKNLAQESMERIRGLPYFISYASQASRVDVLDLYYPSYDASGLYTTVCTPATTAEPPCPKALPAGYTVTFEASFVTPQVSGEQEEFETVDPDPDYAWNAVGEETPPSLLLRMAVTTSWPLQGDTRSFTLTSVVGDRKFEALKVAGGAKVDYGVSATTLFTDSGTGDESGLSAIDGTAESSIESQIVSAANQSVESGLLTVTQAPDDPEAVAEDIDSFRGAQARLNSPPNTTLAAQSVGAGTVTNDEITPALEVAGVDTTRVTDLATSVTAELPAASGTFHYVAENGVRDLWVTQQLDTVNAAVLLLDLTRPMFRLQPNNSSGNTIFGKTEAQTTAIGESQQVQTRATYAFKDLALIPTTYIEVNAINDNKDRSVIIIDAFNATAECNASGSGSGTASATWSATLRYYSGAIAGYETVSLSHADAAQKLADLRALNPIVYQGLVGEDDIHLFEERDPATQAVTTKGYLVGITSGPVSTDVSGDNTTATAAILGALQIDTVTLNPSAPGSTINVNVGRMHCEAVDRR